MHYIWIHDNYTGFMDVTYGKLTVAGWIHLFFSFISGSVVIATLLNGVVANIALLSSRLRIAPLFESLKIFARGTLLLFMFQSIQFLICIIEPNTSSQGLA